MNKGNKNKALFIKTKDLETSKTLENEGFELVNYSDGTWTFFNNIDKPLTFDNNKIAYSDILCF